MVLPATRHNMLCSWHPVLPRWIYDSRRTSPGVTGFLGPCTALVVLMIVSLTWMWRLLCAASFKGVFSREFLFQGIMEAIVVKVAIVFQFGIVERQLSVSCCAGVGNNVELKVIVKTKYQTKKKYVLTIKYCNSFKKFKLFLCVAYMCMCAAELN